jgi:hypothetical protein
MTRIANIIITVFLLSSVCFKAQTDSSRSLKCRRISLITGSSLLTAGSLVYLNQAWYKQYSTGKFHTFNDNSEWLQMDKAGHVWTNYNVGRLMMDAFDWAGYSKKKKLLAGTIGFAYMTGIEIMDGYSSGWGFSWGDMGANAFGAGLAIGQEALWNEQRIFIKYSYRESRIAKYNPALLGSNLPEKLLKDYNAQTYWISCSPFAFCKKDKKVPRWLAISFGYGASNMINGHDANTFFDIIEGDAAYFPVTESGPPQRLRNYYLSIDLDFTKIKTRSKVLKTIFTCLNTVKVPMPAVQFNKNGAFFNWYR